MKSRLMNFRKRTIIDVYKRQVILNTYDDTQLKNTYKAFFKIKDYRTKNKIPNDENICSPWFMPSIGQWFDLLINKMCIRDSTIAPPVTITSTVHTL